VDLAPLAGDGEHPEDRDETSVWMAAPDLLDAVAGDRRLVVEVDGDGVAHLRFSREPGLAPARGTRFGARYRVGQGPVGNVGAETIGLLVARGTTESGAVLRVRNPLPAAGGAAPESIAEVKRLAPGAFRTDRQRAVVAEDYAELVERDFPSEVQGAAATLRWNGSWYEARVGVDIADQAEAPHRLLRRVAERLYRYRRIGHELRVQTATAVPISLALDVCVESHALSAHVKGMLLEALGNRRRTGGGLGLFHPDRLRYGQGIYVSAIVAEAQRVPGVASLAVTRLERLGEGPNHEIENGVLPIGPFEVARLDNDPGLPENGVLEITTGGGR
jgi:predicted phage baseplate assembly protein